MDIDTRDESGVGATWLAAAAEADRGGPDVVEYDLDRVSELPDVGGAGLTGLWNDEPVRGCDLELASLPIGLRVSDLVAASAEGDHGHVDELPPIDGERHINGCGNVVG